MISHLVRRLLPEGWIIERLDTLRRSLQRRYLSLCQRLCEPALGILQLERCGDDCLSDRRKANTRVVVRVTIGHGDVDSRLTQRLQRIDQQLPTNTLALPLGRHRYWAEYKDAAIILIVGQPREDRATDDPTITS